MDIVIFEIFYKYGWYGIIGAILCTAIFFCTKWLSNKLSTDMTSGLEKVGEKLTDQMTKQNDKLIDTIVNQQDKLLNHIVNNRISEQELHGNMVNDRIKISEEINSTLKDIMLTHQAQRAFIIEFHNSNNNLSGIPFAKYSCTYEWFDKGLFALSNKCNALPFSQVAKVTSDVIQSDNQIKVYDNIALMEDENPSLFSVIKDSKTKKIVYSAMYDKNNILIGMLVLEYHTDHDITEEDINQLGVQTAELTSIINLRYKYSK